MSITRVVTLGCLVLISVVGFTVPTYAQAGARGQDEIMQRLRQSGLSEQEIRSRLEQAGYDPSIANPYLEALDRGEPPRGVEGQEGVLTRALTDAGIGQRPTDRETLLQPARLRDSLPARRDSLAPRDSTAIRDSLARVLRDSLARLEGRPDVFGKKVFSMSTSQFEPLAMGPVDPGYQLGPGDQVILVLTGDVEQVYAMDVTREGTVVIPDVGVVSVNGLTVDQLESQLRRRLGDVYSGILEGTTQFSVTLGRLRPIQVFIIGEVDRPGSYQISPASGVFNALYAAGGPERKGSFREVLVRRGDQVVRTVDLYSYLLGGDLRGDVRLQQGDIVFVPLAGPRVHVKGAVDRPAMYEVRQGEGLLDVLAFAGGFAAEGFTGRVQIDRILPPDERRPGRSRTLVDVDLQDLAESNRDMPLQNGDIVHVFRIDEVRRDVLNLEGAVNRPGTYEYAEGMRLWDLLDRADGVKPNAYLERAQIVRVDRSDGSLEMIPVSLRTTPEGRPRDNPELIEFDSVVVYARDELREPQRVSISGWVRRPGSFTLARGTTLKDLVLAAGGLKEGAYLLEAEVRRPRTGQLWSAEVADILTVPVDSTVRTGDEVDGPEGDDGVLVPAGPAERFELRNHDEVYIRKSPGFELLGNVAIGGEVNLPGPYGLTSRGETVVDVIRRAGGLTPEAYVDGFQLVRTSQVRSVVASSGETPVDSLLGSVRRDPTEEVVTDTVGVTVPVDLAKALEDPTSDANIRLVPGDSLHVPKYDPTVLVDGAVAFPARALYRPGADLDYYLEQAGGATEIADEDRVSVRYPNGERATTRKFLFFKRQPRIRPGSSIFVPTVPPSERGGLQLREMITQTTAIVSSTLTLIVLISRL